MIKNLLSSTVLLLFVTAIAFGQERAVTGTVTSADDGSALPGVTVLEKGTSNGTATDVNGQFKISVSSSQSVLVFTFIGLASQEVTVGSQSVINVQLTEDVTQLTEVVVTGYGEREKKTYTGSITQVDAASIENKPVNTIDQVLQGSVPGLQLGASSGTPGAVQDIRIRGLSSLTASNSPLFVIDGVPVISGTTERGSTGSFSALAALNPNDIESMSVLKDATATAVYGARGANGVIIITTKKGKSGRAQISFNAQYGTVQRAVDAPDMLSAAQWDELYYEARANRDGITIADARNTYDSGWDGVTNTTWKDEVVNPDAASQQYDISIRGGNEKTNYYGSIGYFAQDGVNRGSQMDRIGGKVNVSTFVTDKINFSNSLTTARTIQNGQLEGTAYFGSPDAAYMFLRPTDRARNADGTVNITDISGVIWNPLYFPENDIREIVQAQIINNSMMTYDIMPDLQFSSTFSVQYINTEELTYNNRVYGGAAPPENGSSYMYWSRTLNYTWKNQLNYGIDLGGDSRLDASLVYEAQKNDYQTIGTGGYGFAADGLYYPSSVGTPDFTSGFVNDWGINSITGLLTYNLGEKLYVDASLRREGNSRFAPDYRWGTFYSVGTGFILSETNFLAGNDVLTFAKIRASYGLTGNAGIGLNEYQSFLSFSGDYNSQPAVSPSQVGNPILSWEKNNQLTVGLETTLFDRVNLNVEYYNRTSFDLLLNVPLSRTTGFSSQTQNIGDMVNKGFEVVIDGDVVNSGDFRWNLGVNFTTVDNEVTRMPRDGNGEEITIEGSTTIVTEGQPAYAWRMREWAGVDPANGDPLWYLNEEKTETTNVYSDAAFIYQGGSAIATFFGGLNTRLDYKGLYLTAQLYYQTGNQVYDNWAFYTQSDGRYTFSIANGYARQYERWQQPGDESPNPRNVFGGNQNSSSNSSRRLYDGTFLRLRNVTLGYQIPSNLISNLKIQGATVFLQGNNFWTWTKDPLLEFDPEVGADGRLNLTPSVLKTFSLGVNLQL